MEKNTLKWKMPTEKEIESAVLYYLNYQPGVFAFKVNTTGIYDPNAGHFRKLSKWILPGTPDILCCVNGSFCGLEVKSDKGRQSDHQKIFEEKLISKSNGFYFVVRSVKDAENVLEHIRMKIAQRTNLNCFPQKNNYSQKHMEKEVTVSELMAKIQKLEAALEKYKDVSLLGPDFTGDYNAPMQRFYAREALEDSI